MNRLIALIVFCLPFTQALAGPQPYLSAGEFESGLRFGAEMTLSSDELLKSYPTNGNEVRVSSLLAEKKIQQISIKISSSSKNQESPTQNFKFFHSKWSRKALELSYPNGFVMTLFPDPGVIELNTSPSSQLDIEQNLSNIQRDFFDAGEAVGLKPALFTGSGHMHIEVSKLHPVTVRNFLGDFYNATGLSAGALNEDIYNALGSGEMPEKNKKLLRDAFAQFDKTGVLSDLEVGILRAYEIPRGEDLPDYQKARVDDRASKYFAVSLSSLSSLGTIEIRSIRPQASAKSYLKLVKLFAKRMEFAENNRVAGRLTQIGSLKSVRGNPEEVLKSFDRYLSEVGLSLADYREFVMPWWQLENGEVDRYLAKHGGGARSCKSIFKATIN